MWQEERKKTVIRNVIIAVLLLVMLSGIALAVKKIRRQTAEEDEALVNAQSVQRQQQTEAKQEELSEIQSEYDKDMQTVQTYLPGIVCWGDSITAGSSGNISFPYILQKYIDTYICDVYNFRLSIPDAADYSRLDWADYTVKIPVVNMGAGQEDTNTILGRSGTVPYIVAEDMLIPAGCEQMEIKLRSQNGTEVTPLTGGSAGVNNVTINGVEGRLSIDSNSYKRYQVTKYYFTRIESGEETPVSMGTPIETWAADRYRNYLHIICIGTYGGFENTGRTGIDELVAQTKQLVSRQVGNSDRYLVLGMCSYKGFWDGAYINFDILDSAMLQEFGSHYVNVRKYLCEDGLSDYGMKGTAQDDRDAKNSVVPTSFRSTTGLSELNGKAYELIGKLIFDRMDRLGYFDEIRSELYIKESIKDIQKNDTAYFTRQLKEGTALLK